MLLRSWPASLIAKGYISSVTDMSSDAELVEQVDALTVALRAKLFRGLADPSRLSILNALRTGPLSVGEVVAMTGLSQFVAGLGVGSMATNPVLALARLRSEEHTSELQSLMRISYAVFCLKKKKKQSNTQ